MSDWWTRIIVVVLLAVVVGVPVVLSPGGEATTDGSGQRLIILTPHNEQIRFEFARAFNEHRRATGQPTVSIEWRAQGGTSDIRRMVIDQFTDRAEAGREDQGIGADIFFGGGEFEHDILARGVKVKRNGKDVTVSTVVPIQISDDELKQVFPSQFIGSNRLYDDDRLWVGAALSSFGIVFNRDVLGMLDLPEPGTWSDLVEPGYLNQVALADPSHSGSIAAAYEAVLRRMGWAEGWPVLRRVFANARYFTSSANKVPVDVSAGEAAAGMCIDFYGRFQAGAVLNEGGRSRMGYADPPYMTAINADPISVLRGAPHMALAQQFVSWVLSREAQELWQKRLGSPGGPTRFELRRLPVRADLYTPAVRQQWTDDVDPFAIAKAFPDGLPSFYSYVAPVAHAMGVDVHDDLRRAWEAIQRTPTSHPDYPRMLELFDAMPEDLTVKWPEGMPTDVTVTQVLADESHPMHRPVVAALDAFVKSLKSKHADRDALLRARLQWTMFFQRNYRQVARMGG